MEDICSNCTIVIPKCKSRNDLSFDYTTSSSFNNFVSGTTDANGYPRTEMTIDSALTSLFKLNYLDAFHGQEPEEKKLSLCQSCSIIFKNLYQLYNNFIQLRQSGSLLASRISMLDEIIHIHAENDHYCDLLDAFQSQKNLNYSNSLKDRKYKSIKSTASVETQTSGGFFVLKPRVVLSRLNPQEYSFCKEQQDENITAEGEGEEEFKMDIDFDDHQSDFLDEDSPYDPLDDLNSVVIKEEADEEGLESEVDNEKFGVDEPKKSSCKNNLKSSPKEKNQVKLKIKKPAPPPPPTIKRSNRISSRVSKSSLNLKSLPEPAKSIVKIPKIVKKTSKSKSSTFTKTKTTKNKIVKKKDLQETHKHEEIFKGIRRRERAYRTRRTTLPNPCWYCLQDFPTISDCLEHTHQVHLPLGSTLPICQRCSKICISENSLNFHMTKCELMPSGVILPKPFQCTLCPKSYCFNYELKMHMNLHSGNRSHPCQLCPYSAMTYDVLVKHMQNMHQPVKKVKCDVCDKELKSEGSLRWHKYYIHTVEGGQVYRQVKNLKASRRKESVKDLQSETFCFECNVNFHSHYGLVMHQKSCHPEKLGAVSICELCGDNFLSSGSLKAHLKLVHSEADKRPFLCTTCGASFKTSANLKKHDVNTHSEEGRIKFNAYMRERNRRKKMLQSQTTITSSSSSLNVDQDSFNELIVFS